MLPSRDVYHLVVLRMAELHQECWRDADHARPGPRSRMALREHSAAILVALALWLAPPRA